MTRPDMGHITSGVQFICATLSTSTTSKQVGPQTILQSRHVHILAVLGFTQTCCFPLHALLLAGMSGVDNVQANFYLELGVASQAPTILVVVPINCHSRFIQLMMR